MRTIKFRVWNMTFKGWVAEPVFLSEEGIVHILRGTMLVEDINAVPMQFTGLLDKNGKEIYEGDIIEWETSKEKTDRMEIHWVERHQGYLPFINGTSKVIGNIYENPDLLTKSND